MKFCQNKKSLRRVLSIAAVIIAATILCFLYVNDYYKADTIAIEAVSIPENVSRIVLEGEAVVYSPENPVAGFIFYPGGKVEHTAYEPLMKACAEKNILCVLVKMPCNLAVLDMNAADGIRELFPEIESWYIGGHSLGGSMAASYIGKHTEAFDGLILLGAYSTSDLSSTDLNILSVYGSPDNVMNPQKYEKYKSNLGDNFSEFIIKGGNHAYFGMYGEQKGDGAADIENLEQIFITAEKICDIMKPQD